MWFSDTSTPVSSTNGDDTEFGEDHGAADGSCDFLGTFNSETDVAIAVTNDNESLETSTLTSASLFLHRTDLQIRPTLKDPQTNLHDFVLEFGEEIVDNLVLLDGQGM
jgi:hypothetical protein